MDKKKIVVLVLLMQHLFLIGQIPYFNLQINSEENLWDSGSYGAIETDSFYYFTGVTGSPFVDSCDRGLIISINKFTLVVKTIEINEDVGTKMYGIFKKIDSDELTIFGSSYNCHQNVEDDDFFFSKIRTDTVVSMETKFFGEHGWGEYLNQGIQDELGNYVLVGRNFKADNSVRQSILIFKADSSFNEIFYRRYPSGSPAYNYFGNDIVATPDGGYIVVGNHRLEDYTEDAALIFKIDALGNVQWWHEFMPDHGLYEENLYFNGIAAKEDGTFIVIGTKKVNPPNELYHYEHWTLGFEGAGDLLWEKALTQNHLLFWVKINPSGDGNYLVCGEERDEVDYETNYFKQYATVGKITPDGDLLWSRKYHEEQIYANTDFFWNVIPTEDGGILCIGATYPNDEERQNIWVMKLDSLGCAEPDCDPSVGIIELPVGDNSPVLLYPNPASGIFTVAAKDETTFIEKLIINDANGRQVFQKIDNRSTAIPVDLENAAAGMYFCRMEMGGVWYVRQVLVSW